MDKDTIQKVNKSVSRKFPEMSGKYPKVKRANQSGAKSGNNGVTYELTYNTTAKTANGKNIPRWVRVVATNSGKILKISTSR
jgi:hypothetical protein